MKGLPRWLVEVALPPLLLAAIVLVAWDRLVVWSGVPAFRLPRPGQVWDAATDAKNRQALFSATQLTAAAALAGFAVSLVLGTLVALVFAQSRWVRRAAFPYTIFLQTVPIVAIAPLVIKWCGTGFTSVVVVAATISVFPIITNVTAGLLAVEPNLLDLLAAYNASRLQVLLKLRLPNAVPHLVTGAKIACGLAVIGAIVGEFYAGSGESFGLGYLIPLASGQLKTDYLFAAVICSTLLGMAIFALVSLIGATILARWHVK